ncbi:MAG TPA: hypothetical protein VNC50_17250, partial [Planctomycetia bacterium]|nr:hypothetical protein [Planctomycetia bacterium]
MNRFRSLFAWPFRRWYRAVPFCLFALAALWFGLFLFRRATLRAEKARLIAEIRARGEPAEFKDYLKQTRTDDPGLRHLCRALLLLNAETAAGCRNEPNRPPYDRVLALAGMPAPAPGRR